MRLSELSTDRACSVLCALTPYLNNIAVDHKLLDILKSTIDKGEGEVTYADIIVAGTQKLNQLIPLLLKNHKDDVLGILAAINDTSIAEIKKQNIIKTMTQIKEAIKDEELLVFFKSCARQGESE